MTDQNPSPAPQTVVVERSGGSGVGMAIIGLVLLVAVIVGGYLAYNAIEGQNRKNDAISRAADKVGDTADKVGKSVP